MTRARLRQIVTDAIGYAFTNRLHVFCIPVVVTAFWNAVFKLPLPLDYYVIVLLTTAGGYIFNMLTDEAEDAVNCRSRYRLFGPDRPLTVPLIVFCFGVALLLSLRAGWLFVLYGTAIHVVARYYSAPFPAGHGRRVRIKQIPLLKNFFAALQWSAVLVVTPFVYLHRAPTAVSVLAIAVSFGLAYFIELMWDWRDMRGDASTGIRTLPVLFGEFATVWILRVVHTITCLVALVAALSGVLTPGCLLAVALHLPLGLLFLEWYRRFDDKEGPSHVYVVYAGLVLAVGMAWDRAIVIPS